MNKCLICGKETENAVVCDLCKDRVTEELCYRVAKVKYSEPGNELWEEIISRMDKPYLFPDFSLELADYLELERREFVKIRCMNFMNSSNIGISNKHREYVLANADVCKKNGKLTDEENNFLDTIVLYCHISDYDWDYVKDRPQKLGLDKVFLDPYLIKADYYSKIRDYDKALDILKEAKNREFKRLYLKTQLNNYYEKFGAKHWDNLNDKEKIYYFDL